jgi:putative transposase
MCCQKNLKPGERKGKFDYIPVEHRYSLNRACKRIDLSRSQYYYQSTEDDSAVLKKVSQLAERYPSDGQDKIFGRIRNEGLLWNHFLGQHWIFYDR